MIGDQKLLFILRFEMLGSGFQRDVTIVKESLNKFSRTPVNMR